MANIVPKDFDLTNTHRKCLGRHKRPSRIYSRIASIIKNLLSSLRNLFK